MIAADPSGKFVYSTDLGLDRIYQYRLDSATGKLTPNDPPFIAASSPGAGPRHFVFTPQGDGLWLINEEASTLTFIISISKAACCARGKRSRRCLQSIRAPALPPAWS